MATMMIEICKALPTKFQKSSTMLLHLCLSRPVWSEAGLGTNQQTDRGGCWEACERPMTQAANPVPGTRPSGRVGHVDVTPWTGGLTGDRRGSGMRSVYVYIHGGLTWVNTATGLGLSAGGRAPAM